MEQIAERFVEGAGTLREFAEEEKRKLTESAEEFPKDSLRQIRKGHFERH